MSGFVRNLTCFLLSNMLDLGVASDEQLARLVSMTYGLDYDLALEQVSRTMSKLRSYGFVNGGPEARNVFGEPQKLVREYLRNCQ